MQAATAWLKIVPLAVAAFSENVVDSEDKLCLYLSISLTASLLERQQIQNKKITMMTVRGSICLQNV